MVKFKNLLGCEERTVRCGCIFLPARWRHLTHRHAEWLLYQHDGKYVLKLGRPAVIDRIREGSHHLVPDAQCQRGKVRFSLLGRVKLPKEFCTEKGRFQVMVIGMGTHLEVQSLKDYQQTAAQWMLKKIRRFHKTYIT